MEVTALASGIGSTRFLYRAATTEGRTRRRLLRATSREQAARALEEQGLALLAIHAVPRVLPQRPVRRHELAIVFRNVATLVGAGVPIERAIAASEPLVSARLANYLAQVRRSIREGRSVAAALESVPSAFPRSTVGMIRAGECGGTLDGACTAVADQLEEAASLDARVRSALAYPMLIVFVGFATIAVMGTVVVPRFAELLSDLGGELPGSTRALLVVSGLVERFGPLLLLVTPFAYVAVSHVLRGPDARKRLHRIMLRVPVLGSIRLGFASARTCRVLGAMLESGMPLLLAMDASRDASADMEIGTRLASARDAVARGTSLTTALRSARALDSAALQLVGVGEASGQLGPMVSRAGGVASDRAERAVRVAVGLLEPALVVILGVLVALVAGALLQAVYSIRPI